MQELPSSFYYTIGFLLLTNLGAIGTLCLFGIKAVWHASKMDSAIIDAKACAVRAHDRIDGIEGKPPKRSLEKP